MQNQIKDKNNTKESIITSSSYGNFNSFNPPLNISSIDPSSILSFSYENEKATIITKDYKVKAWGNNRKSCITNLLPEQYFSCFTEFEIKDKFGHIWFPISSVSCHLSTLYMVSEVEGGFRTKLVYSYNNFHSKFPLFLNIGNFNPIAIYGSAMHSAAIDMDGSIIFISDSIRKNPYKLIEPLFLPNKEKSVCLAFNFYDIYAVSSKGKLFTAKIKNSSKFTFKKVNELKKIKITQISGHCNFLALSEDGRVFERKLSKFKEILSLRNNYIKYVYSWLNHSFFQTSEGKILACGSNKSSQCFLNNKIDYIDKPMETDIKKDAKCCFANDFESIVFVGCDVEMSPNNKIKDEIKIALFGGNGKTAISQAFIKNNFDDTNIDQNEYNYINIEVDKSIVKLILFDLPQNCDEELKFKYYKMAPYFLFFYDISISSSLSNLDNFFKEANESCNGDIKLAIVQYGGDFASNENSNNNSLKLNNDQFRTKYKCEVFEILSKNTEMINKPFYYFININFENHKSIIKIGKEHRNPFLSIKKDNLNIGLFGNKNVNKTKLAFRFIYEEFYENYYNDYITNFTEIDLTKFIEVANKIIPLSIIDSTFVENIDKSYYSAVQGIIFVFSIEIILHPNYISVISNYYYEASKSIHDDFFAVIALDLDEISEGKNIDQDLFFYEKIDEIEKNSNAKYFYIQ